jgi:hypothetical protein
LPQALAARIVQSTNFAVAVGRHIGASFVTSSTLDLNYLQCLNVNEDIAQKNALALEHLQVLLPFINDVPISGLLKLRRAEGDSFQEFRKALKSMINEYYNEQGHFDVSDARELYGDVINPHLATIERKVKQARASLVRKSASAAIAVGCLAFGVHVGAISPELSALGFYVSTRDLLTQILDKEKENEVRNDSLYYLWKVSNLRC